MTRASFIYCNFAREPNDSSSIRVIVIPAIKHIFVRLTQSQCTPSMYVCVYACGLWTGVGGLHRMHRNTRAEHITTDAAQPTVMQVTFYILLLNKWREWGKKRAEEKCRIARHRNDERAFVLFLFFFFIILLASARLDFVRGEKFRTSYTSTFSSRYWVLVHAVSGPATTQLLLLLQPHLMMIEPRHCGI